MINEWEVEGEVQSSGLHPLMMNIYAWLVSDLMH